MHDVANAAAVGAVFGPGAGDAIDTNIERARQSIVLSATVAGPLTAPPA